MSDQSSKRTIPACASVQRLSLGAVGGRRTVRERSARKRQNALPISDASGGGTSTRPCRRQLVIEPSDAARIPISRWTDGGVRRVAGGPLEHADLDRPHTSGFRRGHIAGSGVL